MRFPRSVRLRNGVLALAALGLAGPDTAAATLAAALVPAAWAQAAPVFEGQGVLELLRPTDLVGDGGSPVELYVLALGPDGVPLKDAKLTLTASGGKTSLLEDAGGGLLRFTFTPDAVDAPTVATVKIKGWLANRKSISREWTVPVAPPRNRPLSATASPAALTLGVDKSANLSFQLGGDPGSVGAVKLATSVSAGTVANVTNLGGGQLGGLYTPPASTTPQVALVTAADSADPTRTYAGVAVPLSAKLDQAVVVAPKSQVLLKIGGRDFGPVPADSKGRAKVPVVVPPGTSTATRVQVAPDGAVSEEPFDLKLPETRRVALFPTLAALPADGRLQVPVRALVVTPDGRPDENAPVVFAATGGTVGPARHEGAGIYVATYTPPFGNAPGKATITARVEGAAPVHADTRAVPLVPARAAKIALSAEPIPAAATSVAVTAKVTGPDGAPMPGRALHFSADGAKLAGVKDLKNGDYVATFTPTGKGPVGVTASVAAPPAGNALARVLVVPSRERLPADGLSSALLTVVTVDELGSPVPNVPVELRVVAGDGSVPPTATTDANGVARVYYTAGRKNGFVGIDAIAETRSAGVSLVQAPPALTLPDLPVVAAAPTRALVDEWAGVTTELRVERTP